MKKNERKTCLRLFKIMLKIRMVEEKIIELYPEQKIRCPVHLCIGQEAIAAGVCLNLRKKDLVFSNHRCHGHYIAKGGNLGSFMAELYGKVSGCSKGKGGSMHLVDADNGLMGTTAIVGAGIPLAVGAAMGSIMQKQKKVSVVFFGDGAVDEGAFYESLNFAALKKLPVVFVCENNFYATNSPQSARQAFDNIHERAGMYGIHHDRVDGNDVLKVFESAKKAVERARIGRIPSLLECRTYRWKGHVGPDCDYEKGCRPKQELDKWLKRCPLEEFEEKLKSNRMIAQKYIARSKRVIASEIDGAIKFAEQSIFPGKRDLLKDVY
ncbi:MAG: thiamine pyrophosphate-dependent dehydrogenase E1 component subunit alpha [Candidatus Omnitrophota bacterium]